MLRAALEYAGFSESRSLTGRVRAIKIYDRIHMPYLDWDTRFDCEDGASFAYLSDSGEHVGDNTDGRSNEIEDDRSECCCCGDIHASDDMSWVDSEDGEVCMDCLHNDFAEVHTGRYTSWMRTNADDVIYCEDNDEYYTSEGASWHDMVYDLNGALRHPNNVTWIESIDEYVNNDEAFEDESGNMRHCDEVTLDWVLTPEGRLSDDLDVEGRTLGQVLFSALWGVRPRFFTAEINRLTGFWNNDTSGVIRSLLPAPSDTASWLLKAAQYGVTYDDDRRVIIDGQLSLRFAA